MARADSPLRDRVVFIVGARRSGTNWLERILTAHPQVVAMPTETYLFSHGIQPLSERFQHANPDSPVVGTTFLPRDAFLDAARELVDRALLETLTRSGPDARYVIERTPWHASHLPLIAEVVPDAHVVHMVRDGRAVARSLLSLPWGQDTIEEAAAEWRDAVRDARAGGVALGPRFREIRYEQLAQDLRGVGAELFAWLGLELSEAQWERVHLEAGAEFNVDPSSPGVTGEKWRTQMPAAQIAAVERVAGTELEAYGYALTGGAGSPPARPGPVAALRARRRQARRRHERAVVRTLQDDQLAHNRAVSEFEQRVALGDAGGARGLLADDVLTRIDLGDGAREDRGDAAAEALLAALAEHRERSPEILEGHVHVSPYGLTTTSLYRLPDGTRWSRVLVYALAHRRLTEVGLYRYELAARR